MRDWRVSLGIALGAVIGGVCFDHGTLPVAVAVAAACGLVAVIVVRRSAAFSGSRSQHTVHGGEQ